MNLKVHDNNFSLECILRFNQHLWMVSGHFFLLIETGPSMLCMVRKIFLYGIRFNIVYNELGYKKYEKVSIPFFHRVQEKISIFLKQRWRDKIQYCVVIQTHI